MRSAQLQKIRSHIRTARRCSKHSRATGDRKKPTENKFGGKRRYLRCGESERNDETDRRREGLIGLRTWSVNDHTLAVTFLHTHMLHSCVGYTKTNTHTREDTQCLNVHVQKDFDLRDSICLPPSGPLYVYLRSTAHTAVRMQNSFHQGWPLWFKCFTVYSKCVGSSSLSSSRTSRAWRSRQQRCDLANQI